MKVHVVWWSPARDPIDPSGRQGYRRWVGAFSDPVRAESVRSKCDGDWIDTGVLDVELDPADSPLGIWR